MDIKNVSKKQLERYPLYLKYLLSLDETHIENVSSPMIARTLELTEEQVRKDLQIVTKKEGKPREGRKVKELIEDLEQFLGYNEISEAIIVGVGHLGQAFMKYKPKAVIIVSLYGMPATMDALLKICKKATSYDLKTCLYFPFFI